MRTVDLVDAYRLGWWWNRSFSKAPVQTTAQGIWFDLSMSPGNPPAQYYSASILQATALARSTDGGIDHGANVAAGFTKYLHKILLTTQSATAAPLSVELLDYLAFYPGIGMDLGSQPLTTSITIPRQTNGYGVQMMLIEQFPYASSPPATGFVTYTNNNGVAGRVTPTFTLNTQVVTGTIATSATATAGCIGRFLPLQTGDTGVQVPTAIEFTSSDIGVVALVLVRPIFRWHIYETTAPCEIDIMQRFGWMPQIQNDAYLNLIVKPNGSLSGTAMQGEITTVWSNT